MKLVADVIKECFMPVAIGGGIDSIQDINDLLKIGADKVVIKTKALNDINFIKEAVAFFGSQCISISVDAYKTSGDYKIYNKLDLDINLSAFINEMTNCEVGEFIINSVDNDGMLSGFDINLINLVEGMTNIPIVAVGGGGHLSHYKELFTRTNLQAVGSASIFHFTQYTPQDIKKELQSINIPVRL
jgi:cyclase